MSHTTYTYPMPTGGLTLGHESPYEVREEGPEYAAFTGSYIDFVDVVDEKLPKARAIAWLLYENQLLDEDAIRQSSLAIVDYLDELRLAHKAMYEKYVQYRDRDC